MGDSSDKFNEDSARELTEYVLKNDIKIYKKFLPVIKQLDSQSFYNMFKGNINYEYKIKNRLEFNLLLNKFDNFKILLEEWYTDKMKYPYIQELWLKYISLAGLSEKKMK